MAALYRKGSWNGKDIVLEMDYTDVGECYQILLGKDGSHVYTDGSLTADTIIETPVTVWRSIRLSDTAAVSLRSAPVPCGSHTAAFPGSDILSGDPPACVRACLKSFPRPQKLREEPHARQMLYRG